MGGHQGCGSGTTGGRFWRGRCPRPWPGPPGPGAVVGVLPKPASPSSFLILPLLLLLPALPPPASGLHPPCPPSSPPSGPHPPCPPRPPSVASPRPVSVLPPPSSRLSSSALLVLSVLPPPSSRPHPPRPPVAVLPPPSSRSHPHRPPVAVLPLPPSPSSPSSRPRSFRPPVLPPPSSRSHPLRPLRPPAPALPASRPRPPGAAQNGCRSAILCARRAPRGPEGLARAQPALAWPPRAGHRPAPGRGGPGARPPRLADGGCAQRAAGRAADGSRIERGRRAPRLAAAFLPEEPPPPAGRRASAGLPVASGASGPDAGSARPWAAGGGFLAAAAPGGLPGGGSQNVRVKKQGLQFPSWRGG